MWRSAIWFAFVSKRSKRRSIDCSVSPALGLKPRNSMPALSMAVSGSPGSAFATREVEVPLHC
eukprot:4798631-Amphidinium_carterae.1